MESWLPFLDDEPSASCPTCCRPAAQVVLVEPRRIRDRGVAAARRGGGAGRDAGRHLGGEGGRRGQLPAPARALRAPAARERGRRHLAAARARGPVDGRADGAPLRPGGGGPGPPGRRGDPAGRRGLLGHAVRRHGAGGGAALRPPWPTEGVHAPVLDAAPGDAGGRAWWRRRSPAGSSCPTPRWRCSPRPTSPAGGCPHRRARPRARAADGFFDDLEAGSFVVHRQHGVARFEGVTTRTMGGHHPRLPDPAVPGLGPPLPAGRADRGDHPLHRRRVADALEDGRRRLAADPGQGAGRRRRGGGRAGASSTGAAWPSRARRSAPTRRGRPRWRRRSGSSRPRTS